MIIKIEESKERQREQFQKDVSNISLFLVKRKEYRFELCKLFTEWLFHYGANGYFDRDVAVMANKHKDSELEEILKEYESILEKEEEEIENYIGAIVEEFGYQYNLYKYPDFTTKKECYIIIDSWESKKYFYSPLDVVSLKGSKEGFCYECKMSIAVKEGQLDLLAEISKKSGGAIRVYILSFKEKYAVEDYIRRFKNGDNLLKYVEVYGRDEIAVI